MIAEPILGGQAVEDAVYEYGDGSPQHIGNWTNWMETSNAVEVVSEFVVDVHLAYPFAAFLPALTYEVGAMISPTFFMQHGGMNPNVTANPLNMNEIACGTGPYMLDEWIQDDRVVIVLYDDYWRTEDARITHPYAGTITQVTWKLNEDINSRMLNLQAGTTDYSLDHYQCI
jgi:peptide/nickel transport system substrate-binding protein